LDAAELLHFLLQLVEALVLFTHFPEEPFIEFDVFGSLTFLLFGGQFVIEFIDPAMSEGVHQFL
jgi:hypothetical protein